MLSPLPQGFGELQQYLDASNANIANYEAKIRYKPSGTSFVNLGEHLNLLHETFEQPVISSFNPDTFVNTVPVSVDRQLGDSAYLAPSHETSFTAAVSPPQLDQLPQEYFPDSNQANSHLGNTSTLNTTQSSSLSQQ